MSQPLLSLGNLTKTFKFGRNIIQAVDDISIDAKRGECLVIAGESGSGKSTLANMILGLFSSSSGTLVFDDTVLLLDPANNANRLQKHVPWRAIQI